MAQSDKSRVLILFCGGTIIMKEGPDGGLKAPSRKEAVATLKAIEDRLSTIADFDIHFVENIDSSNMRPTDWDNILAAIEQNYDRYDGFVVTHGTDTMAYTAAALSLAIKNLGKPVVLTGSQIPGSRLETDARRNLVNAMKLATMDVSGVFVVFDERVILGSRASKASESRLDAFVSINAQDAGEIRADIHLNQSLPRRRFDKAAFFPGFDPDIAVQTLTPGCDPEDLVFLLQNKRTRGIIILAYGTGNLPYDFDIFFKRAREERIPVVVTSQCLHGITRMKGYDVGLRALKLGAIEGHDQSLEMLAVKLMWALKHYQYKDIATVMQTNFAGELSIPTRPPA
ncbi:MAG TPA: asparaginase [Myxococcota bacterium]|nr:asparaginase [Myxococcota bacterium]HPV04351.1 asparaginase [Myxococcota bacterium]